MTEKKPLLTLSIKNFQRIKLAVFDLAREGITQVRGKNAQGKSTALDAVVALLLGRKYTGKEPIHEGETDAEIEGKIGDLTVKRVWTDAEDRGKTKLVITRDGGGDLRKPQTVLDELVASFPDPIALTRMSDADLTQAVLSIVGAGKELDDAQDKVRMAMDQRRDVAREHKAQQAVADQFVEVDRVPNDAMEAIRDGLAAAKIAGGILLDAQRDADQCRGDITRNEGNIDDLVRQLKDSRDTLAANMEAAEEANQELARLEALPAVDPEDVLKDLQAAQQQNMVWDSMEPMRSAVVKAEELSVCVSDAGEAVVLARTDRDALLNGLEWPSEGLGYDPEQGLVTLNGHLFSSASTTEKTIAAVDMIVATDAAVPLILVRQGNDLDAEHLDMLNERAVAAGWQVLLERVDDDPDGPGIYIEDGQIKGDG